MGRQTQLTAIRGAACLSKMPKPHVRVPLHLQHGFRRCGQVMALIRRDAFASERKVVPLPHARIRNPYLICTRPSPFPEPNGPMHAAMAPRVYSWAACLYVLKPHARVPLHLQHDLESCGQVVILIHRHVVVSQGQIVPRSNQKLVAYTWGGDVRGVWGWAGVRWHW